MLNFKATLPFSLNNSPGSNNSSKSSNNCHCSCHILSAFPMPGTVEHRMGITSTPCSALQGTHSCGPCAGEEALASELRGGALAQLALKAACRAQRGNESSE